MTGSTERKGVFRIIGPGLLVAATGVGAGDLASAGFAGSRLGLAVLWAIVVGAALKFFLTEGLARWQLATGQTLLEGACRHLGRIAGIIFLAYLLPWSFFVGAALINACAAATIAFLPPSLVQNIDLTALKLIIGATHSAIGVVLVLLGGFRLFERVMAVCIAIMVVTVLGCAILLGPDIGDVLSGLFIPRVPDHPDGLTWTVALMGGVGGTVTILCYGYWIREKGCDGPEHLRNCRIDLGVGYAMTALFGISVLIIATGVEIEGRGASLVIGLGNQLSESLGPVGQWVFLVGAWAAMFSSLLGVWQAIPYLFADIVRLLGSRSSSEPHAVKTNRPAYRLYLLALATVPIIGVAFSFEQAQKLYTIVGAGFLPMLALVLLLLNGRRKWVGTLANGVPTTIMLIGVLFASAWAGKISIDRVLSRSAPVVDENPDMESRFRQWNPRTYRCAKTTGPITVDGRLDEADWQNAEASDLFIDIEGDIRPAPHYDTRVKMLWDDEYMYFGASMEEPHLWGRLTERDSVIFHDNDFEIFIDPDGDSHLYGEFEINALCTEWDLLLIKPYRDGGPAIDSWDIQGLKTAVHLDGTLNDPSDTDRSWSVEIAIPFEVLNEILGRAENAKDGVQWRVNFSRVQWDLDVVDDGYKKRHDPDTGKRLPERNWVWSPQFQINMHAPEYWGIVEFSDAPPGPGPAVEIRDDDRAAWALRQIYLAQRKHRRETETWTDDLSALEFFAEVPEGWSWPPVLSSNGRDFRATITHTSGRNMSIDEKGQVR